MKIKIRLVIYFALLVISTILMVRLYKTLHKSNINLPRDYKEIMISGVLNVVTDYNTFGYHVAGDSTVGFQYEMIKILEKDWNIKIDIFLENSLDNNLKGLEMGKYDIVARNIPINSALRDNFNFTQFMFKDKQVLVQRKQEFNDNIAPIRQHLDLAKKTIFVHRDSPIILRLQNLSNEIGDTIYIEQNDIYEEEQLVMMVAGGDIDFTVCNEKVAKRLALELPEIDIETDISFTQLESWAVRKSSPVLLDSLNSWLINLFESEKFKKTLKKYS